MKITIGQLKQIIREEIRKKRIEESDISSVLIGLVALLGGAAVKTFGEYFFRSVISGARAVYGDIKNIVAPESYIKFLKKLENNDKFNKEFIKFTIDNKKNNILNGKNWIDGVTELPSFVSAFKTFATEENFSDVDKNEVLDAIKTSMQIAYRTKADVIYKKLKQKYPEISSELTESIINNYIINNMKINTKQLRQIIREEIVNEGRFLRPKSPLIEKDPKNFTQEDQLEDDLIVAYKWAFGKVWEKAKKLSPQDPEHKKLLKKMKDLGDEIEKLVKRQHNK
jgi:hypothetical protein